MVDALNHALDEELARDPSAVVFGQDVAHGKGGVFNVTSGLTAKYGSERVFNSQLAESSIAGVAIGLATHGTKAIGEIQFGDYVWTAMMQIRNELAMLSYRSRGDFTAPVVLRIPVGGYIHGGLYHSQNIEATFSHFPGIFVVYPSNATDAKGLLKAAIRGKDPVLFLEHKGLYRQVFAKGPEGGVDDLVPLGRARIARAGDQATVVTWGALVHRSLQAAEVMSREGIEVEVIDLRSIVPLDSEAIFESVRKTGRLLVAHEDMVFAGFGSEIVSQVSDTCFEYLDAPIRRVGMKYVAGVPHSPELEAVVLPNEHDVLAALRELLAF
jgi:2-oxoisovalerate dehydrogenase E1 component